MGAYVRGERRTIRRKRRASSSTSPGWSAGATSRRARSAAASSRCWRWRARLSRGRGCCCSTSRRSGSRRPSSQELFRIVKELNAEEGLTVLVVEQNANVALDAAARAYVLEVGQRRDRGRKRRAAPPRRRPQVVPRGTDGAARLHLGRVRAAGDERPRRRLDLREPRARARPDLPDDERHQLRTGRDGDLHDVHRLDADGPRRPVLAGVRAHAPDRVRRRRRRRARGDPAGRAPAGDRRS